MKKLEYWSSKELTEAVEYWFPAESHLKIETEYCDLLLWFKKQYRSRTEQINLLIELYEFWNKSDNLNILIREKDDFKNFQKNILDYRAKLKN